MPQSPDEYAALTPVAVESETILDAGLDDTQSGRVMRLSYAALEDAGWESDTALDLLGVACEDLAQWCLHNGRYAHGVADAPADDAAPFTELDRRRYADAPPALARGLQVLMQRRLQRKRYAGLPTWSILAKRIQAGDALLVAAWLIVTTDLGEIKVTVVDQNDGAPPPQAVPLVLSYANLLRLRDLYSRHASMRLPCRVLGLHSVHDGVVGIDVLQLEVAPPLFSPSCENTLTSKAGAML